MRTLLGRSRCSSDDRRVMIGKTRKRRVGRTHIPVHLHLHFICGSEHVGKKRGIRYRRLDLSGWERIFECEHIHETRI